MNWIYAAFYQSVSECTAVTSPILETGMLRHIWSDLSVSSLLEPFIPPAFWKSCMCLIRYISSLSPVYIYTWKRKMFFLLCGEGGIKPRDIMPLSFVGPNADRYYCYHALRRNPQLTSALSQEGIFIFLSYLLKSHPILMKITWRWRFLPLIILLQGYLDQERFRPKTRQMWCVISFSKCTISV